MKKKLFSVQIFLGPSPGSQLSNAPRHGSRVSKRRERRAKHCLIPRNLPMVAVFTRRSSFGRFTRYTVHGRGANRNNSRRPYISSFRHGGDLETRTAWNGTPPRILVNYCGVTSEVRLTRYWFLKHILLIPPMLLFGKKSQKTLKKCPKNFPK